MATVWRARDLESGATVAVKLSAGGDDEDLRRFALEADLLESLAHPGVAGYVARGETDDGAPYLAMEWLEGEDLGQRLRQGRLTVDEAWRWWRPCPTRSPSPIAAASCTATSNRATSSASAARRGPACSTSAWPAPTARRRRPWPGSRWARRGTWRPSRSAASARSTRAPTSSPSVCVLYECLTGVRPFARKDVVGVLLEALHSEPAPLGELVSDVPAELEELVHRMLSKRAEERPADAGAVARELRALPRAVRYGCRYLHLLRLRPPSSRQRTWRPRAHLATGPRRARRARAGCGTPDDRQGRRAHAGAAHQVPSTRGALPPMRVTAQPARAPVSICRPPITADAVPAMAATVHGQRCGWRPRQPMPKK